MQNLGSATSTQQALYCWNYEEIVDRWYEPLFKFACRLSHSGPQAADLTQETFRVFFTKSSSIKNPSKVKAWLFTTLHRQFLVINRREKKWPEVDLESIEMPSHEDPSPENIVDSKTLLTALAGIEDKYRLPILLFYMHQLTYKEIAAHLDIKIGTVMSRISRGKHSLRDCLDIKH